MSGQNEKKREAPVSYRPPRELREEFRERVEKSGLSTSAFITNSIFNVTAPRQSRRPPVELEQLAKLLAQSAHIRDVLEELLQVQDSAVTNATLLKSACDDLTEIRGAILKLAARRP